MIFIESRSVDPRFNLALEQYVFDSMPRDQAYFILWQNDNTIVIGKHQNTLEEINLSYVKEHDITVVRRLSGGGAVYHDLGNVNFTFIADAGDIETINLQAFCIPVVRTLERIGIQAELSGRNDITIDGRKFSGNAQYVRAGRIMHHGTLMFDSDLSVVSQALRVPDDKFTSKGFKSVRSRVTNIRPYLPEPISMEEFKEILRENLTGGETVKTYELSGTDLAAVRRIQEERYNQWDWNFGHSPKFSVSKRRRIEGCGQIEVQMDVREGEIRELGFSGDFFGEGLTPELRQLLIGTRLREEDLLERLAGFPLDVCFKNLTAEEFAALLLM